MEVWQYGSMGYGSIEVWGMAVWRYDGMVVQ